MAGRLWSEAVASTGLELTEGLQVARQWADETGHPWPPDQGPQGKLPYSIKSTGDLRDLVTEVFTPHRQGPFGIDAGAVAQEMRVFDRLPWKVIEDEIGCGRGTARDLAYRHIEQTDAGEWVKHKPLGLWSTEHKHIPCLLYEDRLLTGDAWDMLAKRYLVSPPGRAIILAAHFADDFGLPWPVPPLDWEPPEEECSSSRAYFYRGSGLRWRAVGRLIGRARRRTIDAAKEFARYHDLPWPVILPWTNGSPVSDDPGFRSGGGGTDA